MSLKRNILASYVSQLYVTLVSIFMVPMLVRYMGVEAYGLVGFFAMLQAWFQLLDVGLTPTLARETARFVEGSDMDALHLRRLMRSLEVIFIFVALFACSVMIFLAGSIASNWLKVQRLPLQEVQSAISLMALNIGVRWMSSLYRGAVTGFERLVWLSGLNILMATARFLLVIPFFVLVGTGSFEFFGYQLLVSIMELFLLVNRVYQLLPKIDAGLRVNWQWKPLRLLGKFSLSMAFANLVWVMATQTDKLLLSKLLPLEDYAYFSLATLMAGGIFIVSNPISVALLPRLSKLASEENQRALFGLYREATQLVGVIVVPAVLALSFFAERIAWVWTGNADLAHRIAPVLTLYALGNGVVALGAFPYYLQFAKGDLRLHTIGTALVLVTMVPAIVWGTLHFGVIGAGYAWLGVNTLYFMFWLPKVHRRFAAGLHSQWLLQDIGIIALATLVAAALIAYVVVWPASRVLDGLYILMSSAALLSVSAASSSQMRAKIGARWQSVFTN